VKRIENSGNLRYFSTYMKRIRTL